MVDGVGSGAEAGGWVRRILEDPWFDAFAPGKKKMFTFSVGPEDVTVESGKGWRGDQSEEAFAPMGVMQKLNQLRGIGMG